MKNEAIPSNGSDRWRGFFFSPAQVCRLGTADIFTGHCCQPAPAADLSADPLRRYTGRGHLPAPLGTVSQIAGKPISGEYIVSKLYLGIVETDACRVYVRRNPKAPFCPLPPRNDLRDHSPGGFAWGYDGSGPTQLALALAVNVLGSDQLGLDHYDQLRALVARLPHQFWELTEDQVWEQFHCIIV